MKKSLLLTLALALVLALACAVANAEANPCSHPRELRQKINVVEPTCVEPGSYDEYCPACMKTLEHMTESAKGHVVDSWVPISEPTCNALGREVGFCDVCKNAVYRDIAMVGHKIEWVVTKEATCYQKGEMQKKCVYKDCKKDAEETKTIEKLDHTWGEWKVTKEASCWQDGEEQRNCTAEGCKGKETRTIKMTNEHVWRDWKVTKKAKCEKAGSEERECDVDGCPAVEKREIAAIGHDWSEWTIYIKATCTSTGWHYRICANCKEKEEGPTPATGHTPSTDYKYDKNGLASPTCTKTGTGQKYCTNEGCKHRYPAETVPMKEHSWSAWKVSSPATCTGTGKEERTCSVCKKTEDRVTLAKGHTEVEEVKPATCTTAGYTATRCSVCKKILTKTVIKELGHDNQLVSVKTLAKTCDTTNTKNAGQKDVKCSRCGHESTDKYWLPHVVVNESKKPTCSFPGYEKSYCIVCDTTFNFTNTENLDLNNHDYPTEKDYTTVTTCYQNGKYNLICTGCEKIIGSGTEDKVPHGTMKDDKEKTVVKSNTLSTAATCTEPGKDVFVCAKCNQDKKTEVVIESLTTEVPAKGHNWYIADTKDPTCRKEGEKTYGCKNGKCDAFYTVTLPKLNHSYTVTAVTTASCGIAGINKLTCTENGCGETWYEIVPAKTHEAKGDGKVTLEPTCTKDGVKTFTCKNCGKDFTEAIDKLGHKYSDAVTTTEPTCTKEGVKTATCARCKETVTEAIPATGHTKGDYVVTTAPTCTTPGVETAKCAKCDYTETKAVPATGHTMGDYVVTTPAGCMVSGVETAKCANCDYTETKLIPATGHTMGDFVITIKPTCVANGVETSKCKNCYYSENRDVEAIGHNYVCVVANPTCTEAGMKTYTCLNCGDIYTEIIPALGHDYETVIVREPKNKRDGEKADICSVCGAKTNVQVVEYVEMHFGCTMTLDGIQLNNLDAEQTVWNRVAVVDTTVDGAYTFNLVVDNKWTIGTATVTVANGTVTVTYKAGALKIKSETITVYDSLDALKADEGTVVKAGEAVAVSGNTAFIALNAIVNFDAGDYRVADYVEDAELIAEMKALIA